MKIYIRAYWFDDNNESIDDFIYGRNKYAPKENNLPEEYVIDEPYDNDTDFGDFDDYDFYGYSEYEDFYRQIMQRKVYVPSNVANDIPDYNAYRKVLFGTLYLSKSGESIETLYNELSRNFPGIIKDNAINPADMLLEIVDATLYAQNVLNER